MSAKFSYDTIAMSFTIILYCCSDISNMTAMNGILYAKIKAFPRSTQ